MEILEAGFLYVLMTKEYRVSRCVRIQWFLDRLNKTVSLKKGRSLKDCQDEISLLSVIPRDQPLEWRPDTSHLYKYLITPRSTVIFLTHRYRVVYCLDMSPSLSAVDIQHGEVLIDEVFQSFKKSLQGITKPFFIPGSCILFSPDIYLTVIAHTPFFRTPAQQVLVQGWRVTSSNLEQLLSLVIQQLQELESAVAEVSGVAHDCLDSLRAVSEKMVGGLFEENAAPFQFTQIPMVSPDTSFINMLRYGMLALRLLPESSSANLIVVTDGIVAIPDVHVFDSVLTQLRTSTVACSFLHVGSLFHPHSCKGLVPYIDLMQFISAATCGTYMTDIFTIEIYDGERTMNTFHMAFLTWSFQRGSRGVSLHNVPRHGEWQVSNSCFYGSRDPRLLRKKQVENNLCTSLVRVLCCRLKEGYTVKNVVTSDNHLQIYLSLHWKNHIYIEYVVSSQWPITHVNCVDSSISHPISVHYTVSMEAPYEFLHDVTCLFKKPFKSQYRQAVVSRFWATLKNISQSDQLLAHLGSFINNTSSYNVPETIRSGMPLYYLPSNSTIPVLSSSDATCPQFAQFWRPICLMEPTISQKWFHVHRLGLILQHDRPLPKHLHLASASGRYQIVQCRQAAAALHALLKDWSTFVLIENHSYIKLVCGEHDKPPVSFYLIQVTSKSPCVVINLSFLGGTPSFFRHEQVQSLTNCISQLTSPQRPSDKVSIGSRVSTPKSSHCDSPVDYKLWGNVHCCHVLQKPLEKILIRYEKMPADLTTVVFPDGTQAPPTPKDKSSVSLSNTGPFGGLLTTLSRYFYHRRWVWSACPGPGLNLGLPALARILSILTHLRLQEGFKFAHSTSGIINMVLEVKMKVHKDDELFSPGKHMLHPCVIQYVLFPPHACCTSVKESESDDSTDDGECGELQIVTECWIEPQYGTVIYSPPERSYMEGLSYHQLPDMICQVDAQCISSLLTFEHLKLMCSDGMISIPLNITGSTEIHNDCQSENHQCVYSHIYVYEPEVVTLSEKRIHSILFGFDVMNLLPKCQQAELLFSTFVDDILISPLEFDSNGSNILLLNMVYDSFCKLHDRELDLTVKDCTRFMQQLQNRRRYDAPYSLPVAYRLCKHSKDFVHCVSGTGSATKNEHNNSVIPMWRCFVKTYNSQVVLTFVPKSLFDLKLLMINDDTWNGQRPQSLKLFPSTKDHPREVPEFENHRASRSSSTEMFSYRNINLCQRQGNKVQNSGPESPQSFTFQDSSSEVPFRVRASSWDTVTKYISSENFEHTVNRIRTGSIDSKIGMQKHAASPVLQALRMRSDFQHLDARVFSEKNFHTDSVAQASKFEKYESKDATVKNNISKLGRIVLPVYVYDCPLVGLMDVLVHGYHESSTPDDIYRDYTNILGMGDGELKFETEKTEERASSPGAKSDDSDILSDIVSLTSHCIVLKTAYRRYFVSALFEALNQNKVINSLDVKGAILECEESVLDIDITNFIQTVCSHLREFQSKCRTSDVKPAKSITPNDLDNDKSPDVEERKKEMQFSFSQAHRHSKCCKYEHLHHFTKQKFLQILAISFKQVPTVSEFYFYAPCWKNSPQIATNEDHTSEASFSKGFKLKQETPNAPEIPNMTELHSNSDNQTGGCVTPGSDIHHTESGTTPDDMFPSLDSDMSELNLEMFATDVRPLFFNLRCTLTSHGISTSSPIQMLPTCLGEITHCVKIPQSELDAKDVKISLNFVFHTLPPVDKLGGNDSSVATQDDKATVLSQPVASVASAEHEASLETPCSLRNLPDHQYKAVITCITETQWLMRDEIASFLLVSSPLEEKTLKFVTDHVTSSPGRPSCMLEKIPLQFVFDIEESRNKFFEEFVKLRVNGYHICQEGHFYYLVKDKKSLEKPANISILHHHGFKTVKSHIDESLDKWAELNMHTAASSEENVNTTLHCLTNESMLQDMLTAMSSALEDSETDDEVSSLVKHLYKCKNQGIKHVPVVPDANTNSPFNIPLSLAASPSLSFASQENRIRTPVDILNLRRSHSCGVEGETSPVCLFSTPLTSKRFCHRSEVSSLIESAHGTEDSYGYDGDSSDSADEQDGSTDIEINKPRLPGFWLVFVIDQDITCYFHCRSNGISPKQLLVYHNVHKNVLERIKDTCKLVNQTLLLQNLHDTRMCSLLLEQESNDDNWQHSLTPSLINQAKTTEDSDTHKRKMDGTQTQTAGKFYPGWFACNVVWEAHFTLHPRLKTGPGKAGFSRGIQAMCTVLNRFSVNNRKNMFVYRDSSGNVFYLRLHENENLRWQNRLVLTGSVGPSDNEENYPAVISRSSSVASLRTRKTPSSLTSAVDEQLNTEKLYLQSPGDRELAHSPAESFTPCVTPLFGKSDDSVVLKVHGISEAGPEVKEDLVQVLQNRLDDAVLEMLSVMLARNPMCKLTPHDVHFIQKPFHPPDSVVQFTVHSHAHTNLQDLTFYLHQNLLQFLHLPKYTEPKADFHFQDFSQQEYPNRYGEGNFFLYNQSTTSGNKGIACIAVAMVDSNGSLIDHIDCSKSHKNSYTHELHSHEFSELTSCNKYDHSKSNTDSVPEVLIEFRIWKQGRVNLDTLSQKLQLSIQHSLWDLIMECRLLTALFPETNLYQHDISETPKAQRFSYPVELLSQNSLQSSQVTSSRSLFSMASTSDKELHSVFSNTMQPWLDFAIDLCVPAVKKHSVKLSFRHQISVTVREVRSLIMSNVSDMHMFIYNVINEFSEEEGEFKPRYVPLDLNKQFAISDNLLHSLMFGRSTDQWYACTVDSPSYCPESPYPKVQKGLQKFTSLLVTTASGIKSVPRQRFLLCIVEPSNITLFTYNLSKERVENIFKELTNLGLWLSARSILLSSIYAQKLGLFHSQALVRHQQFHDSFQGSNPYLHALPELGYLMKFVPAPTAQKDPITRRITRLSTLKSVSLATLSDVFRDEKPSLTSLHMLDTDPFLHNAQQLKETKCSFYKEKIKKLRLLWQARNAPSNFIVTEDILFLFKQQSRMIHYCLTPILFLPRWKLEAASTRDHTLAKTNDFQSGLGWQKSGMKTIHKSTRQCHSIALSPPGSNDVYHYHQKYLENDEKWHKALCANFVKEYKQYLQTLGFLPIKTEIISPKNRQKGNKSKDDESKHSKKEEGLCYLQKSLLGGILIFEIFLRAPFFHARLHALECSHLQPSVLGSQFIQGFLDECDRTKILVHLHSFTYDYHLRSIYSYVSGCQTILKPHYHIVHFLDDFLKYYSKAPNFARNLAYVDTMRISNLTTPARQLFNYLLSHEKNYNMEVFSMVSDGCKDDEYVLVQLGSKPHVTYHDSNDVQQSDDFDVLLIIAQIPGEISSHLDSSTTLNLKYYIVLSSHRELYPKIEMERKLGKFCTVSTVSSISATPETPTGLGIEDTFSLDRNSSDEKYDNFSSPPPSPSQLSCNPEQINDTNTSVELDTSPSSPRRHSNKHKYEHGLEHRVLIRQESVNYLGYYSSHEQLMQKLMMEQAEQAKQNITDMVMRAMIHCRTHILWNKLHCTPLKKDETFGKDLNTQGLSYPEFMELNSLAEVEPLSLIDSRLEPLLYQSLPWYQSLAKVLLIKYGDCHRVLTSPDGNMQHIVVLHPKYLESFIMLTVDTQLSRGELFVVSRKIHANGQSSSSQLDISMTDKQVLIENFVNTCCFHLWTSLL